MVFGNLGKYLKFKKSRDGDGVKMPVEINVAQPDKFSSDFGLVKKVSVMDSPTSLFFKPLAVQIASNLGVGRLKKVVETSVKGTKLEPVEVSQNGINFGQIDISPLQFEIKTLYNVLYKEVLNSFGAKLASEVVQKCFVLAKDTKDTDTIAELLALLPSGVLETEKLQYQTRDELQKTAGTATEEKQKREIAEKAVVDLDKTKRAMINLLEDARALEATLKIEKDRANAIVTSMGEGLIVVDANYNTTVLNKVAETIIGLSAEKLIGKNLSEAVKIIKGDQELKLEDRPIFKTLKTGVGINLGLNDDMYIQGSVNKKIPISVSTSALKTGDLITGAVIVFKDITPEKENKNIIEQKVVERTAQLQKAKDEISRGWLLLQQEKARLSASISSLSLGFLMVGLDGLVVVANPASKNILGLELTNKNLIDLQKTFGTTVNIQEIVKKCHIDKKLLEVKEVGLGVKFLHIFVAPILSDVKGQEDIGTVFLFEDITEEKIIDRSRDEFFSIASHELRTPLTAIRGNVSLIKDMYAEKLKDPELVAMINDIHESAIRLIDIVNDFLNVSRLEMGKITFKEETFDLIPLVGAVIAELAEQANQKKLILKVGNPALKSLNIFSDSARVKEVLINLVGNAIKYTEKGSVTVDAIPVNGYTKISVKDSGGGISADGQKLLFRKFQQAGDSLITRDTTRSTGLGLYISKMIVEGMGGKIWLEASSIGVGSVFSFTVPTVSPAANVKPKVTVSSQSGLATTVPVTK